MFLDGWRELIDINLPEITGVLIREKYDGQS